MQEIPLSHRNNNFDFLRLFAAIGVIFSHSYMLLGKDAGEPLFRLTKNWSLSEISVYIFFIISGYLITRSYHAKPKTYWRNRMLRIGPALAVNILVTIFIIGAIFTKLGLVEYFINADTYQYGLNITTIIFYWFLPGVFKNNHSIMVNGSLWTLGYEVIMYFCIWCVGRAGLSFKKVIPMLAALFLLLRLAGIPYYGFNGPAFQLTIMPDTRLALLFIIGSGFYIFRDKIIFNMNILILLMLLSFTAASFGIIDFPIYIFLPYAVFYFAFSKTLNLRRSARYGDFSYGLYIYAYPVQQTLIALNGGKLSPLALFLEALIITFVFASASWHLVEKHALKLKFKSKTKP